MYKIHYIYYLSVTFFVRTSCRLCCFVLYCHIPLTILCPSTRVPPARLSFGGFLIYDVQVNIRMACGHRELWYCPVGSKFTKPKAGLWWTLFLVLPFLCPLRCEVNSTHQREVPQRAYLMLSPPPTYTQSARLLVHAYSGRRIHFTFEKLKKRITLPICLAI